MKKNFIYFSQRKAKHFMTVDMYTFLVVDLQIPNPENVSFNILFHKHRIDPFFCRRHHTFRHGDVCDV